MYRLISSYIFSNCITLEFNRKEVDLHSGPSGYTLDTGIPRGICQVVLEPIVCVAADSVHD